MLFPVVTDHSTLNVLLQYGATNWSSWRV